MENQNNTNQSLTLCSLFDGSGGFCLGGLLAGIKPISCSEIEPFPIRVTTKRMPWLKHYGDVTKMHGGKIEPVQRLHRCRSKILLADLLSGKEY